MTAGEQLTCLVDHQPIAVESSLQLAELDANLRNRIKRDYPQAKVTDYICGHHLLKYRLDRVDAMINADLKQTQKINHKLTRALQSDDYDVVDVNEILKNSLTFGQRVSDDVARFGGSWGFIFVFMFVLLGWMIVNGLHLFRGEL
jgi:Predicted membrane protein